MVSFLNNPVANRPFNAWEIGKALAIPAAIGLVYVIDKHMLLDPLTSSIGIACVALVATVALTFFHYQLQYFWGTYWLKSNEAEKAFRTSETTLAAYRTALDELESAHSTVKKLQHELVSAEQGKKDELRDLEAALVRHKEHYESLQGDKKDLINLIIETLVEVCQSEGFARGIFFEDNAPFNAVEELLRRKSGDAEVAETKQRSVVADSNLAKGQAIDHTADLERQLKAAVELSHKYDRMKERLAGKKGAEKALQDTAKVKLGKVKKPVGDLSALKAALDLAEANFKLHTRKIELVQDPLRNLDAPAAIPDELSLSTMSLKAMITLRDTAKKALTERKAEARTLITRLNTSINLLMVTIDTKWKTERMRLKDCYINLRVLKARYLKKMEGFRKQMGGLMNREPTATEKLKVKYYEGIIKIIDEEYDKLHELLKLDERSVPTSKASFYNFIKGKDIVGRLQDNLGRPLSEERKHEVYEQEFQKVRTNLRAKIADDLILDKKLLDENQVIRAFEAGLTTDDAVFEGAPLEEGLLTNFGRLNSEFLEQVVTVQFLAFVRAREVCLRALNQTRMLRIKFDELDKAVQVREAQLEGLVGDKAQLEQKAKSAKVAFDELNQLYAAFENEKDSLNAEILRAQSEIDAIEGQIEQIALDAQKNVGARSDFDRGIEEARRAETRVNEDFDKQNQLLAKLTSAKKRLTDLLRDVGVIITKLQPCSAAKTEYLQSARLVETKRGAIPHEVAQIELQLEEAVRVEGACLTVVKETLRVYNLAVINLKNEELKKARRSIVAIAIQRCIKAKAFFDQKFKNYGKNTTSRNSFTALFFEALNRQIQVARELKYLNLVQSEVDNKAKQTQKADRLKVTYLEHSLKRQRAEEDWRFSSDAKDDPVKRASVVELIKEELRKYIWFVIENRRFKDEKYEYKILTTIFDIVLSRISIELSHLKKREMVPQDYHVISKLIEYLDPTVAGIKDLEPLKNVFSFISELVEALKADKEASAANLGSANYTNFLRIFTRIVRRDEQYEPILEKEKLLIVDRITLLEQTLKKPFDVRGGIQQYASSREDYKKKKYVIKSQYEQHKIELLNIKRRAEAHESDENKRVYQQVLEFPGVERLSYLAPAIGLCIISLGLMKMGLPISKAAVIKITLFSTITHLFSQSVFSTSFTSRASKQLVLA